MLHFLALIAMRRKSIDQQQCLGTNGEKAKKLCLYGWQLLNIALNISLFNRG